ncbi:hypothetical protein YTPLAS18_27400 [Nitrospira sp.]|nr:hypothetical protein YTPLAS18_27400 [Nitrospira sp.]
MEHDKAQSTTFSDMSAQSSSGWTPQGPLTIAEAGTAREELLRRVGAKTPFTIDLSRVEKLDSAGLQVLVSAVQTGLCSISQIPDAVKQKLDQAGCLSLLAR